MLLSEMLRDSGHIIRRDLPGSRAEVELSKRFEFEMLLDSEVDFPVACLHRK